MQQEHGKSNMTRLILQIDSITFKAKKSAGNRRIKYFIKGEQLHEEIMTKKQYKKQNKKLDRQIQSCLPGMWEEYELFEAKQKNRYLLKVDSFNCTKSTSAIDSPGPVLFAPKKRWRLK